MRYAAIYRRFLLEQPSTRDGDYLAIGVWTLLSVYAADHELGEGPVPTGTDVPVGDARIVDCAGWSDRMWLTSVSVDRFGVDKAVEAGYATWDGADLLVHGYDLRGQAAAESHRKAGKKGGRPPKNQEVSQKENQAKTKRVTKKEPPTLPNPTLPNPTQPRPTGDAAGAAASCSERIAKLESKYPAGLAQKARRACLGTRKSQADSVWLKALESLAAIDRDKGPGRAAHAMRVMVDRHATDDKREPYMLAIARNADAGEVARGGTPAKVRLSLSAAPPSDPDEIARMAEQQARELGR